jgi:protocatechuate 3,4-dioxygenase beta subunit
MRKVMFLLGLICCGVAAQDAAFEGTAVNSVTGKPVSGVHVRLYSTTAYGIERAWASMSDKRGHFSINPIPAGRYGMTVSQAGFDWVGPNGSNPNDNVWLQTGQKINDFKLIMAPEAVIRGRVLDDAGVPVEGVKMALQPASRDAFLVSYADADNFTNERGEFRIAAAPGKFYVVAWGYNYDWAQNSNGRNVAYYPDARDASQGKAVEAVAGRETTEIEIRMAALPTLAVRGIPARPGGYEYWKVRLTPGGAIAGRVSDDEGKPVEHAQVFVVGVNPIALSDRVSTDGEGRFRISGLRPGKYRVRASYRDSPAVQDYLMPPEIRTDGTKEAHYSPTFYGGTLTLAGSARVRVPPGGEASGIEIKLARTPAVSISGRVDGFPAGAGRLYVEVRLPGERLNWTRVSVKSDGTFHVWKVDPGEYALVAVGSAGQQPQSAPVKVKVAGKDIENLELPLFAPVAVPGVVQYLDEGARWGRYKGPPGHGQPLFSDGGGPLTSPLPTRLWIAVGESYPGDHLAVASSDGRFTFEGLPAGQYRIQPEDRTTYVKWLRWGTETIDGNVFEIRAGAGTQPLVVALSSAMASVAGVVRDAKGTVADARVLLIAEDENITGWNPLALTRADGSYEFRDVIPGKYQLVTVDKDDFAALQGLALEDYAAVAVRVNLQDGDIAMRDLRSRGQ